MEGAELARRKALQAAVAALCVEVGFVASDKDAMGTLSEILQSYVTELGRTSRMYSELAQRTEPTVSDVQLALIDAGADIKSLPAYAKRPQRRHLHRQSKNYLQPQPKCLQIGTRASHPPNIPPHLPSFPDPHTYIKTPVFATPSSEYRVVREKLATQKRNSRKGLSGLLAKTRPSCPVAGESDPFGAYTVVKPESSGVPVYLQALMPMAEDLLDTTTEGEDPEIDHTPSSSSNDNTQKDGGTKSKDAETMDTNSAEIEGNTSMDISTDSFENPFLKAPKQSRPSTRP